MSGHSWLVIVVVLIIGLKARTTVTSPAKRACDKQDEDVTGTLCNATITIKCYCHEGSYLDIDCDTFIGNIIDKTNCNSYCKPCPSDEFSPYENRCSSCQPVTECKINEKVITNATGRYDRVCGCRDWPIPLEVCEEYKCTNLTCPLRPEQTAPANTTVCEEYKCTNLTCPLCPEQTAPANTTVAYHSTNAPQAEKTTSNQWILDGWSFVLGVIGWVFLVYVLCLALLLFMVLWKKEFFRRLLAWIKVAKEKSDPEGEGSRSNPDKSEDSSPMRDSVKEGESDPFLPLKDLRGIEKKKDQTLDDQLKIFRSCIQKRNMKIRKDVPRDGNCFFHAVNDQMIRLGNPEQSAADLRKKLVEFLCTLGSDHVIFKSLVTEDKVDHLDKLAKEDHLDKLAKDGTFADHQDVAGTAQMLKRDLIVYKNVDDKLMEVRHDGEEPLLLGLVKEHYISLCATTQQSDTNHNLSNESKITDLELSYHI